MTKSILKAVFCGIIVGALAFFVPGILLGIFVFAVILRIMHSCHHGHGGFGHGRNINRMLYLADKIRKMNDEEYEEFKTKMGGSDDCCDNSYHHRNHCCCKSKMKDQATNDIK